MERTNFRWIYVFLALGLIVGLLFPPTVHAESKWLKHFRKDSLLNTYKTCYAIASDSLFVGTNGDGLLIYTPDGKKINYTNKNTRTSPDINDGLVQDNITCIAVDERNNDIWVGTINGLAACSFDGKEWRRFGIGQGVPGEVIRDVDVDGAGNVWVGTSAGVAVSSDGATFHTFKEEAATGSIHSIKIKDGVVWVGHVSGLIGCFSEGKWKTVVRYE